MRSHYDIFGIPRTKVAKSLAPGLIKNILLTGAAAGGTGLLAHQYYGALDEAYEGRLPAILAGSAAGGIVGGALLSRPLRRGAEEVVHAMLPAAKGVRHLGNLPGGAGPRALTLAEQIGAPVKRRLLAQGVGHPTGDILSKGIGAAAGIPLAAAASEAWDPTTGEKIRTFFGDEPTFSEKLQTRMGL